MDGSPAYWTMAGDILSYCFRIFRQMSIPALLLAKTPETMFYTFQDGLT